MKTRLTLALFLLGTPLCWAQVPPNDDFTNRIPLAGPVTIFGGDISQATFSLYEVEPCAAEWCGPSAWWSWTATDGTPVIIERIEESFLQRSGMAVYAGSDLSMMYSTEVCRIDIQRRGQYAVFQPQPGIEYKILVSGFDTNPVTYRLTVTNAPVFRLQPLTQTVTVGMSTIFNAFAVGIRPLQYQWRRDSTNIPYATNQMISLDHMRSADAGDYSVTVTSPTGCSTSQVAQLFVTPNDAPPRLIAHKSVAIGVFSFSVSGEVGRRYRLESSNDLKTWSGPRQGGVIFNTNIVSRFQVYRDAPAKFLRLSPHHAGGEVCANNIRQFRSVIWIYAEENHLRETDSVDGNLGQLHGYFINGVWPRCPSSPYVHTHDYAFLDPVATPVCIFSSHVHFLEDQ